MLSLVTFFKVLQIFGLQFSPSHYAFAATVCDGASCANDEADTTQTFFIQKRAGLVGKHDEKGKDAEVENAHLEKIIRDAEMQDPTCKFETLICGCGGATPPPTPVPPTPVPPTPSPTPVPMNWVYANGDFTEASGGIQLAQPGHSHDGAVTQQESAAWTAAYFTLADGPASFEFSCTASTDDNLHVGLTSRQQNFETRQHWADVEYAAECHYGRQNGPQAIQFWWTQYSDGGLDLENRNPGNIEGPWNESTRIKIAYEEDGRVHGYVDDVEKITYNVYGQDVAGQGYTELMPALVGRVTGHGILNAVWTTPTPLTALNQRNNHLRELVKEKETQDPRCLLPDMICGCADGAATPPPTPPPTPAPTLPPTPPMNTEGDGHCVGATGKLVPMWWRGDTTTSQCREYCLANTDCVAYSMANPRNQCYQHVASSVTNVAGFQLHPWSTDAGRGFEQPPVMGADSLGGGVNEYTCYYNAASSLREQKRPPSESK